LILCFFFSSRRRHTRFSRDWSSDVCSSDLDDDGYIRLPRRALDQLRLVHLVSGLDGEACAGAAGAVYSAISGYTEWATTSSPARSEERRVGEEGSCRWWPERWTHIRDSYQE